MAKEQGLPKEIPTHVAIIMDGNGRWAQSRGLPRLMGHRAGTENLRTIIRACGDFGVKYLTLYAFSTENWDRPEDEVKGLMKIFDEVFEKELAELIDQGANLKYIGRREGVSEKMLAQIKYGEEITKENDKLFLSVAFNYGGRDEIVHAIQKMIEDGIKAEDVSASLVSDYMYTSEIPDPDLVIRTSGEKRLSNFLTWQTVYSEWYFPNVNWPDFNKDELMIALQEYSNRQRRFGKI